MVEPGAEVLALHKKKLKKPPLAQAPAEIEASVHVDLTILAMISRTLPLVSGSSAYELTLAQ